MKHELEAILTGHGQQHVLTFWDQLDDAGRRKLAEQIKMIDFARLARLIEQKQSPVDVAEIIKRAAPPPAFRLNGENRWSVDEARRIGEAALAQGKVGAILVAGGQGSRLGFNHPKGMLPVGPVSGDSLFKILFEKLLAVGQRFGKPVRLYLMTSPATHEETLAYLAENRHFGVNQGVVFCQGQMPAVDIQSGRLLLESKDSLALSPDGHGGMLSALSASGGLADMTQRGLEHIFYFQVDNPLVQMCDPVFLGYHLLVKSEMSSQVVAKRYPLEKVGNVVDVDGRLQIVEYSDLPEAAANLRNPDGSLKIWAGSIAIHFFERSFLDRVQADSEGLPFHIAKKKVPHVDAAGQRVEPTAANAIKFERFVFDLLPKAERAIVVEIDPAEGFAPVKNGPGEKQDTLATMQAALVAQHTRWLTEAGATVAPTAPVEISPLFAIDADELAGKVPSGLEVTEPRLFC